jgi:hypothetical protein
MWYIYLPLCFKGFKDRRRSFSYAIRFMPEGLTFCAFCRRTWPPILTPDSLQRGQHGKTACNGGQRTETGRKRNYTKWPCKWKSKENAISLCTLQHATNQPHISTQARQDLNTCPFLSASKAMIWKYGGKTLDRYTKSSSYLTVNTQCLWGEGGTAVKGNHSIFSFTVSKISG